MQSLTKPPERIVASYAWVTANHASSDGDAMSPTRDVFRARLDRFYKQMGDLSWPEADRALLTAVIGEIGNNCFDHNLGQWRDEIGCWFEWGFLPENRMSWIVIADRGQGIRASLTRVDPSIQTDQEALDAAFSRILSGRSPERRGNGLKFVKQIVNDDSKRGLLFLSGEGQIVLGHLGPMAEKNTPDLANRKKVQGTWALLLGERL
jgi:hypothetical protein